MCKKFYTSTEIDPKVDCKNGASDFIDYYSSNFQSYIFSLSLDVLQATWLSKSLKWYKTNVNVRIYFVLVIRLCLTYTSLCYVALFFLPSLLCGALLLCSLQSSVGALVCHKVICCFLRAESKHRAHPAVSVCFLPATSRAPSAHQAQPIPARQRENPSAVG